MQASQGFRPNTGKALVADLRIGFGMECGGASKMIRVKTPYQMHVVSEAEGVRKFLQVSWCCAAFDRVVEISEQGQESRAVVL